MLTRREAIVTGLATATLPVTAHALPSVIRDSPFLSIQLGKQGQILRARYCDENPYIGLQITIRSVNDGFYVADVEAAEDYVLNSINVVNYSVPYYQDDDLISTLITRSSNLISMRTRRAPGNGALMHPSMINKIMKDSPQGYVSLANDAIYVGRWKLEGIFNTGIKIYSSLHMSINEIAIFYNGYKSLCDNAGMLLNHDDKFTFVPMMATPQTLGDYKDYIDKFSIDVRA